MEQPLGQQQAQWGGLQQERGQQQDEITLAWAVRMMGGGARLKGKRASEVSMEAGARVQVGDRKHLYPSGGGEHQWKVLGSSPLAPHFRTRAGHCLGTAQFQVSKTWVLEEQTTGQH